ncbi:glucose-6-phosphate isomerase [Roseibacterium sp. SDUM158017]|uniref:glycine zipper 2TM domain-containing protein n=1 Tax=Roseicyclus salinarum TaxID=3036773 RepID=UPI0024152DB1|nr:glucose-6-phosphate isomerase [Roseibacterium sp. SDUM158017]MDG4648448.1 glucose-6-phosphate isomerase [Roseibacterium sp. SDUM158017]
MTRHAVATVLTALTILSGCEDLTPQQRTVVGITAGAAVGLITAEALEADDDWRLIAALAGAAAGTIVAQNSADDRCAYSRGDATFYIMPCP